MSSVTSYNFPEPIKAEICVGGQLRALELEGSVSPADDAELALFRDLEAAGLASRAQEPIKRGKAKAEPENEEL